MTDIHAARVWHVAFWVVTGLAAGAGFAVVGTATFPGFAIGVCLYFLAIESFMDGVVATWNDMQRPGWSE